MFINTKCYLVVDDHGNRHPVIRQVKWKQKFQDLGLRQHPNTQL